MKYIRINMLVLKCRSKNIWFHTHCKRLVIRNYLKQKVKTLMTEIPTKKIYSGIQLKITRNINKCHIVCCNNIKQIHGFLSIWQNYTNLAEFCQPLAAHSGSSWTHLLNIKVHIDIWFSEVDLYLVVHKVESFM